jgi:ABC-2 type transport system ATP-binding protein
MHKRIGGTLAIQVAAFAAFVALVAAPAASARDDSVTSFDGTRIVLSFFPAEGLGAGERAPTILIGPGWSSGRDTDQDSASNGLFGLTGVGAFRRAGYNVLTWDPRGFGESGGTVQVDSPQYEGRDVQALIDYVARQPEAQLDRSGDPRVGMSGASYGGGIQLVTAAIDGRLDAIAPVIAWHSLVTSLYKAQSPKAGWGTALFALGVEGSTIPGLPAGETGNLDPHITSAYTSGLAYGEFSDEDVSWFASRGPGALVDRIRIPTLLIQGTADTLFTLDEAVTNYRILRGNKVPVKMVWFCGGHGVCLTGAGPAGYVEDTTLRWFARHLRRDKSVATGPRFEWIADDAQVRTAADYPLAAQQFAAGSGSGLLALTPDAVSSGTLIAATPSPAGLHIPLRTPAAGSQTVGPPRMSVTYSGLGTSSSAPVYAQVVDKSRNLVVGNVVTPVRLVLDGLPHTLSVSLEEIAASVGSGSSYELQLIPASSVYAPQRVTGLIDVARVDLALPVAGG